MGGIKKIVKSVSGGLLGGVEKPKVQEPRQREKPSTAAGLDPNKGRATAEAKRKKQAQAQAAGRSSLRIDLAGAGSDGLTGRSGLRIS